MTGWLCIRGQCPTCRRTVNLADHQCPGPHRHEPGAARDPRGRAVCVGCRRWITDRGDRWALA